MPQSTESVALAPEILPPRELPAGSVVAGRYRIGPLIGRGGFAHVYRARDEAEGAEVALKVLRADRFTAAALRRLEREAALAAGFDHPHLVRVLDAGRDGDLAYLAMELVAGPTLRERLREGPPPVDEAVRLAGEILDGLAALHARGVLHRDVKPGNVLLGADGRARLADLGLALPVDRDETRATSTAAIVGTLDYLSPEQALGEDLDARSDLYSVGLVLFEMLTGRLAFERASTLGVLLARLQATPPTCARCAPTSPPGSRRWSPGCSSASPPPATPRRRRRARTCGQDARRGGAGACRAAGAGWRSHSSPGRPAWRSPSGRCCAPPPASPRSPSRTRPRSRRAESAGSSSGGSRASPPRAACRFSASSRGASRWWRRCSARRGTSGRRRRGASPSSTPRPARRCARWT
ncbi:MAG: serine/threonine protein kinase [Thermoanaerobaculia bacterium]|nr:serine/threonine protein kinase [Thermoanaerobaculia bacterium]